MTYVATATPVRETTFSALPPEAIQRISEAVSAAEQKTSAEIRVVVSRAPLVQHPFFSVMWAAVVALVVPWFLVFVIPMRGIVVLEIQAIIFMVVAGILMLPSLFEKAVPRLALKAAARSAAIEAFLAHGIPQSNGRTGILIFVAARERLVEVVADRGPHTTLGPAAWADICEAVARNARQGNLAEGLVSAVDKAGDLLAGPLPRKPGEKNELDNGVVIL